MVTVVMPAHNMERYIERALRSAVNQSYPNLDILVIDDGSTDRTAEIAGRFARRYPNVRVVRTANGGVAAARNLGVELADSFYVAFLDADDLWAYDKVEKQVAALAAHGHEPEWAACYTLYRTIDEDDGIIGNGPVMSARGAIFEEHLECNHVGNGSSLLVRRDVAIAVGGFNPQYAQNGIGGCEDFEFQLKILQHHKMELVQEFGVGYRIHQAQMSADIWRMTLGRLAVIETIAATTAIPESRRKRVLARTHLMKAQYWKRARGWLNTLRWIMAAIAVSPAITMEKALNRLKRDLRRLWNRAARAPIEPHTRLFYQVDPVDGLDTANLTPLRPSGAAMATVVDEGRTQKAH
jgi:glycosyltransferase involved in cell wall biosynthesis